MHNRVLFIGLDAADPSLIEKWMNNGDLPNLKALFKEGQYKRIGNPEDIIANPWISFYSGLDTGDHGIYHYINWDPKSLETRRILPEEIGLIPFWHNFKDDGPRTIAVDLPMTTKPDKMHGVEINGFANHEILAPFYTYPQELESTIKSEFGPPYILPEKYGLHTGSELIKMKTQLIEIAGRLTALTKHFIRSEQWDLFMVVFGETHRGGHKLWDLSGMVDGEDEATKKEVTSALKEIYQVCDNSIGELVKLAGEYTTTLVCSLHGMGPNTSRIEIFPEMLSRVINTENNSENASHRPKLSSALRKLIPLSWRHSIKSRLPIYFQDSLTAYWRMGGIDWKSTPAFSLVGDIYGLVRINLIGREAKGIVQPGKEYEYWLNTIDKGLRTFVDADTNRPIVSKIIRRDQYAAKGKRFENLPDLFVVWYETPSSNHREIVSPDYGSIPWPTPYHNPDGRSGNHHTQGFLIAAGEGFTPETSLPDIRIQDITATILDLLGQDIPANMIGKSII